MSPKHVPEGFRTVNPYLTVRDCARLIDFMESVLGAERIHCETGDDGRIVNAAYRIGDSVVECSDATGRWTPVTAGLHVFVPDCDACFERAVAAGASVLHEPADMPYGERSAGVTDPTGNNWYFATHLTGRYEV